MVSSNVSRLYGFVGFGILASFGALPIACGDDKFSGCEASRTCKPSKGGGTGSGGESGGGADTGGSSGASGSSGSGASGASGTTGGDGSGGEGGESGSSIGGSSGDGPGGEGGESGSSTGVMGGTGGMSGSGGMSGIGGTGTVDTTPPTVVSVSPANGATGVRADANIVITFSEPMDRVATQAAYQSAEIPAGAVTFGWSADSTVLTINPNTDLAYGSASDTQGSRFTASLTDTAEDGAGNSLAQDFTWSFRTLRRITQTLSVPYANVAMVRDASPSYYACIDGVNTQAVGRVEAPEGVFTNISVLVSIDISTLPNGIAYWESATLTGTLHLVAGMTEVPIYHVSILPPSSATWSSPSLGMAGMMPTPNNDTTPQSANVLAAVVDDYQNRSSRLQISQFRIALASYDIGSISRYATFRCGAFSLSATFLTP